VDGNWRKIGKANFYSGITIDLMQNSEYYTENEIKTQTIRALYSFIDQQLAGTGITWTDADKEPELYMENVVIARNTDWETDFSAEAGYLYFVFEDPIPGYTTTYGFEEHGVFDQDQSIEIVNTTTRGELDVTKTWAGENSADGIYFTVKRNGTDITAEIVTAPTSYGLTESDVNRNANHISLIVPKGSNGWDTLKIKNLLLADYKPDPADDIPYVYTVQEIGYYDTEGDHWTVDEFLTGYSMSEPGQETANTGNPESGGVKLTGTDASTITIHNETPTELSFTKKWRKNGFPLTWQKPISVTMNAYADDPETDVKEDTSYTLSPENHEGWTAAENNDGCVTFTISGLRAFDDNGNALTYYVKETGIAGYTTSYADADGNAIERAEDGQTIINTAYIDVRVIKRNYKTQETMTGAEFRLDRKTETGYEEGTAAAVGDDGTLVFEGLADGEYRIAETKPPAGYIPLASPIRFTIEDGIVSYAGGEGLVTYTAATADAPAAFTVDNRPGVALPSTGGEGTAPYIVTGIALMALAGTIPLDRKRKAHK
jgi:LPXTG-motif cell wall-anchored protein